MKDFEKNHQSVWDFIIYTIYTSDNSLVGKVIGSVLLAGIYGSARESNGYRISELSSNLGRTINPNAFKRGINPFHFPLAKD